MKKIVFTFFVLAFCGCAKKQWNKEYIVNKCLGDFTKRNEKDKQLPQDKIPYLCDCVATKLTTNYKSEAEADRDPAGEKQIGKDCALEIRRSMQHMDSLLQKSREWQKDSVTQ